MNRKIPTLLLLSLLTACGTGSTPPWLIDIHDANTHETINLDVAIDSSDFDTRDVVETFDDSISDVTDSVNPELPGDVPDELTDNQSPIDAPKETLPEDVTDIPGLSEKDTVEPLCLTTTSCVTDLDCPAGMGIHCNSALVPPKCQYLYCGLPGTECSENALCKSQLCFDNLCCVTDCTNKICGDDGCGGSCGTCDTGYECNSGVCDCIPDCGEYECGLDPFCGTQDCGACSGSDKCLSGKCQWAPDEYTIECGSDGMCFVPAGPFWMGCNETVDSECDFWEKPYHEVSLSGYFIDKTEVTQSAYGKCIDAGSCSVPAGSWDPTAKPNNPVEGVSWNQANGYCEWSGKRLPTEAEWEKAARGTDGRKYPWGNEKANCSYAIISEDDCCHAKSTWEVCSKSPAGNSPYGLCDMVGNISEWVSDFWRASYYSSSPSSNPTGPDSGSERSYRSLGCRTPQGIKYYRASFRFGIFPTANNETFGFRCAKSP